MQFLTEKQLADEIYDTIFYTEKYLLIISPFIQLDKYFKDELFKTHLNNSNVHIILAFGKNENNINKSFNKKDIEFFTKFPNITIIYLPNLHAKYYGNEKKGIITSMNLIDYSFLNNIEFGVLSKKKLFLKKTFFKKSQDKCFNIIESKGYTIFVKRPKYKKKILIGKDYVGSEIELDLIDDLEKRKNIEQINFSFFTNEKYVNSALKEKRKERELLKNNQKNNIIQYGHCIRCNTKIELDLEKPLCKVCYQIWSNYKDPYYPENYCISCGEKKETNLLKPACFNCYKQM